MLAQPERGLAHLQPGKLARFKRKPIVAQWLQYQRAGVAQFFPVFDHLPFLAPIQDRHQDSVPQQQAYHQNRIHQPNRPHSDSGSISAQDKDVDQGGHNHEEGKQAVHDVPHLIANAQPFAKNRG